MSSIAQLRDRHPQEVGLVDRIIAGLRDAHSTDSFVPLQRITQLHAEDAPVLADVLATLVEAGHAERRIVLRIADRDVEEVYPDLCSIPLVVTANDGTQIPVLLDNVRCEYRGTASL
jgi:hypothetical protein